jgi:hypothetical protein
LCAKPKSHIIRVATVCGGNKECYTTVVQETWLYETVCSFLRQMRFNVPYVVLLSHLNLYLRQFHDGTKLIKHGNSWRANKQSLGWCWNCPPFIWPEGSVLWVVRLLSSGCNTVYCDHTNLVPQIIALNIEVKSKVVPVHAMKAYRGRRRMAPHILKVVTSRSRRFTRCKQAQEARLLFNRRSCGSHSQDKWKENRNLLPLLGFETRNVQTVA